MQVLTVMAGLAAATSLPWPVPANALCPQGGDPGDRALVIGISRYAAGASLTLEGPRSDREEMRRLLIEGLGYKENQVCVLKDEEATKDSIRRSVEEWLIEGTRTGDRVFFYFSGHGEQVDGHGEGDFDESVDEALVTYDFSKDGNGAATGGYIRDDEISGWFARLEDRQVTAVVDSCFSGTIYRGASPLRVPDRISRTLRNREVSPDFALFRSGGAAPFIAPRPGLSVWMAASPYQLAFDEPDVNPRFGHFTNRWIDMVRNRGGLPNDVIVAQLRQASSAYCESLGEKCSAGLTPALWAYPAMMKSGLKDGLMRKGAPDQALAEAAVDSTWTSLESASDVLGGEIFEVAAELSDMGRRVQELRVNATPRLRVRSSHSGYLTVFAIKDGRPQVLLPTTPTESIRMPAEKWRDFEAFRAAGPAGPGRVVAVVTEQPLALRSLSATRGATIEANDDSVAAAAVDEALWTLLAPIMTADGPPKPRRWGSATVEFIVTE